MYLPPPGSPISGETPLPLWGSRIGGETPLPLWGSRISGETPLPLWALFQHDGAGVVELVVGA